MENRINKVKYERKSGQVTIEYEQVVSLGNSVDEIKIVLKSNDEPLDDFKNALGVLSKYVDAICELPVGFCHAAEIRGVSFSWANEVMGAVITALVPVESANAPVVINTPHLPSDQYNDGGQSPTLPKSCVYDLKKLLVEVDKYIKGDRKPDNQQKLELE